VTARQIEFQRQLTDGKGRSRFVDFAIHARNGRRIAIELDGRQKTADGRHRSQEAFDDFNDRQNELMLQGWLLLRYSNSRSRLSSEEPGDLIYHEAGWRYYESTTAERCFRNGTAAERAGFRASEVR
jgi:very-short-patch-repair endonuclease